MKKSAVQLANKILMLASQRQMSLRVRRLFTLMYLIDNYSYVFNGYCLLKESAVTHASGPIYPRFLERFNVSLDNLNKVIKPLLYTPGLEETGMYSVAEEMIIISVLEKWGECSFNHVIKKILPPNSPSYRLFITKGAGNVIKTSESSVFYSRLFETVKNNKTTTSCSEVT